jgi:hypothetical protein
MLTYADVCAFVQRVRHKLSKTFDDNGYMLWQVAHVASIRVLIPLYMCPHTSLYMCPHVCPHTSIYVSSCLYICVLMRVLIPLYMCPRACLHASIYESPLMCPHTSLYVSQGVARRHTSDLS